MIRLKGKQTSTECVARRKKERLKCGLLQGGKEERKGGTFRSPTEDEKV